MKRLALIVALLWSACAHAATITITWTAGAGYPGGTTYELYANECHKTGLTGTSTTCSLPAISNPATQPVVVLIRAVPSTGECNGTTCPSDWVVFSSVDDSGAPDTEAPSTPTGLSCSASSATAINCTWTASTDNVAVVGYDVRRCSGAACTPSSVVSTAPSNSFGDSGLTASTLYRYTVQAKDAAPNLSSQSSVAQATTNAPSSYTVTPSVTLGSSYGSISPSTPQTVTEGNTQAFTVTPNGGYQAIMGGTCGGSLVSTTYTTNAVTANCSVTAWFIPSVCALTPNPQTPLSTAMTTQTGTFTYNSSVIPVATNHNLTIGHVNGTWSAFTSFATIVRFGTSGVVDVRNGGSYAADAVFNYSANTRYNVRFVVDRPSHTYSVWIAQDGGAETQIANNYAFRTEQDQVTQLTNFTHVLATGSPTGDYVCPLGLSTVLAAPINLRWSPR